MHDAAIVIAFLLTCLSVAHVKMIQDTNMLYSLSGTMITQAYGPLIHGYGFKHSSKTRAPKWGSLRRKVRILTDMQLQLKMMQDRNWIV